MFANMPHEMVTERGLNEHMRARVLREAVAL
jgi:hypothetical protein